MHFRKVLYIIAFVPMRCIKYGMHIGYAGYARLAQLAEHLTLNQGVQGSNP